MILHPWDPKPEAEPEVKKTLSPNRVSNNKALSVTEVIPSTNVGAGIQNILASVGLIQKEKSLEDEADLTDIQKVFKDAGAGISTAAATIAALMTGAEKDEVKLRAAEVALKLQGIVGTEEKKKGFGGVTINIMNSNGEQRNLINLVMPLNQ